MQNLISNHWLGVVLFLISVALVVYTVRSTHSILLKVISGAFCIFMLLAVIGWSMESSGSNSQSVSGEAQRQKATFSTPSMKFFSFLFNDTGSSNPTKDIQSAIEKEFSSKTYFSKNPELLPLAEFISGGDINALRESLKEKPQLAKEVTSEGYSLLHFAVLNLNEGSIKLLLDLNSNPNQIYNFGGSSGHIPLTYLLDKYQKMGSSHPDENLVLRIVDMLDKSGTKLNPTYTSDSSKYVRSPVSYASLDVDWQKNVLKKLVADGANIDNPGFRGRTILYEMITISKPEYVQFLLELGANPNHKTDDGDTPADYFCKYVTDFKERGIFDSSRREHAERIANILKEKKVILKCEI